MLEEISQKTGDTVIIAARNGIFSQYIHVLQARSAMRFHVPHGTRRLVVWSATGFALLTRSTDWKYALCAHGPMLKLRPDNRVSRLTRCWKTSSKPAATAISSRPAW